MKKIFIFLSLSFLLFFGIAYSAINVQAFTNEKYDVTIITLVDGSEEDIATLEDQDYGSSITPISSTQAPEGFEFSFWIVNNIVRKDLESDHTFFVTANLEITAVFEPIDNSKHAVLFMDSNGRFIEGRFVENGGTVATPSTLGYSKPNYVVADEPWKDTDGNIAVFENITESKVFVLQYKPATEKVVEISVNGDEPVEYAYNEIVTVSSDLAGFTHWEEDGVIVSYKKDYSFTALANRNLVAKNDGTEKPLVSLLNVTGIREDYKSFLGQVYLPEGYTLIEAGILASNNEEVLFLETPEVKVIQSNSILETTNEFLRSFPEGSFSTFRAYTVLKNEEEIHVVYSENNYYSVPEVGKGYTETFDDSTASSSYGNGSFTGVQGLEWTFVHSRTEDTFGIDGKGILLRRSDEPSSLTVKGSFDNGISSFSFEYRKAYTGGTQRTYKVDVFNNGITTTYDIPSFGSGSGEDSTIYTFNSEILNLIGEIEIKIYATGSTGNQQMTIDNFKWFEVSEELSETKLYNVEFNVDENSTNDSVRLGETVNEPTAPTKTGYTFIGWFDENDVEFDFDTEITSHIKLYAKFSINQYTLTFDTNGGSEVEAITADFNTPIVPPTNPTKEGYTFGGWSPELPTNMPASNATYSAIWTPNQYTITFVTNGGSEVEHITAAYGSVVSAPESPTKDGKFFAGWYTDEALTNLYSFTTMPINGITLYAKWEDSVILVTVEFDSNGGSEVLSVQASIGNPIEKPVDPIKDGYTFAGWFIDNDTFNNEWNFENPVIEDMVLYANWNSKPIEAIIDTSGSYTSGISDGIIPSERLYITNPGANTITVSFKKNNSTTNTIFNNGAGEIRLYGGSGNGGELTISINSGYITKVIITTSQNNGLSINGGSSQTSPTINMEISNLSTISIKNIASSNNQVRITDIKITYIPG